MKNKTEFFLVSILICLVGWFLFSISKIFLSITDGKLVFCNDCLDNAIPRLLERGGSLVFVFALISLVVTLLKFYFFKKSLIKIDRKTKVISSLEKKYSLEKRMVVFQSQKPTAFCVGFFTPKIYLSSKLFKVMSMAEIEAIIIHEKQHILNKDNIKLSMVSIIKSTFFFFPVIGDLMKNMEISQEIRADEDTIITTGKKTPLMSALRKAIQFPQIKTVLIKSFYQNIDIEPRIYHLINGDKTKLKLNKQNVILSLISVFLILNVFTNKIETHSILKTETILCVDKGTCQNFCGINSPILN